MSFARFGGKCELIAISSILTVRFGGVFHHKKKKKGLGELKPKTMTLQLADRFVKIPRGIVEDVLIKVDVFYFPIV